jgi:hypothetical protein
VAAFAERLARRESSSLCASFTALAAAVVRARSALAPSAAQADPGAAARSEALASAATHPANRLVVRVALSGCPDDTSSS